VGGENSITLIFPATFLNLMQFEKFENLIFSAISEEYEKRSFSRFEKSTNRDFYFSLFGKNPLKSFFLNIPFSDIISET